jgi:hypothetical protein
MIKKWNRVEGWGLIECEGRTFLARVQPSPTVEIRVGMTVEFLITLSVPQHDQREVGH